MKALVLGRSGYLVQLTGLSGLGNCRPRRKVSPIPETYHLYRSAGGFRQDSQDRELHTAEHLLQVRRQEQPLLRHAGDLLDVLLQTTLQRVPGDGPTWRQGLRLVHISQVRVAGL